MISLQFRGPGSGQNWSGRKLSRGRRSWASGAWQPLRTHPLSPLSWFWWGARQVAEQGPGAVPTALLRCFCHCRNEARPEEEVFGAAWPVAFFFPRETSQTEDILSSDTSSSHSRTFYSSPLWCSVLLRIPQPHLFFKTKNIPQGIMAVLKAHTKGMFVCALCFPVVMFPSDGPERKRLANCC